MNDAVVRDPELGLIQVYREYIPREDAIEYTTYFRVDGKKYRNDLRLKSSDLEGNDNVEVENFVRNRIVADIRAGNFVDASNRDIPVASEVINKMRETKRDEKWYPEEHPGVPREQLDSISESVDNLEAHQGENTAPAASPSETELVIVALLMRNYDISMALLSHFDKETADRIYDAHENGGTFNPPIFIPTPTEIDPDNG